MTESSQPYSIRFKIGIILFILSIISPIGALIVGLSDISGAAKVFLSGIFLAGLPEVLLIAAVAVVGKEGYEKIKCTVFRILRRYGPPQEVSKARHTVGLVMFILPLVYGFLIAYLPFDESTFFMQYKLMINLVSDFCFILSFFVLGGNFWDKLRALFNRKAKVST